MIFTIKVNYKSGVSHTFDVTEFSLERGTYRWKEVSQDNKPFLLGADNIESIWQVGVRESDND